MDKRSVSFRRMASLWIVVFTCAFGGSEAALRTLFVEDLCHPWSEAFVDLHNYQTGILSSVSSEPDFNECIIRLKPEHGASVVLSVYRFNLGPEDKLIIEDSQKFKVGLIGEGDFPDERKSFASDGVLTLHYSRDGSNRTDTGSRLRFQFVFTQTLEGPCRENEFSCRNKRCIPERLVCDRHNHCGDNSDQADCGPRKNLKFNLVSDPKPDMIVRTNNVWIIMIVVSSAILAIIVIVFIGVLIRNTVRGKRKAQNATVAQQQQSPTAPAHQTAAASHSVLSRIRDSFRRQRPVAVTETPEPEDYQVPSMYPHIPSAPQLSGVDNPEFRAEV